MLRSNFRSYLILALFLGVIVTVDGIPQPPIRPAPLDGITLNFVWKAYDEGLPLITVGEPFTVEVRFVAEPFPTTLVFTSPYFTGAYSVSSDTDIQLASASHIDSKVEGEILVRQFVGNDLKGLKRISFYLNPGTVRYGSLEQTAIREVTRSVINIYRFEHEEGTAQRRIRLSNLKFYQAELLSISEFPIEVYTYKISIRIDLPMMTVYQTIASDEIKKPETASLYGKGVQNGEQGVQLEGGYYVSTNYNIDLDYSVSVQYKDGRRILREATSSKIVQFNVTEPVGLNGLDVNISGIANISTASPSSFPVFVMILGLLVIRRKRAS